MTEVILATLAFYLFQLMLPHLIAVARGEIAATSLLGARDQVVDNSIIVQRASRAAANMQESMIVFLPLAGLAVASSTSVAETATIWLGLRVAHLITYLLGISFIRTLIWYGTLYCLGSMAIALV